MADEVKPEAAAPASPEGTESKKEGAEEQPNVSKKASFISKLLSSKIIMIVGTALISLSLGAGAMWFVAGNSKKNPPKKVEHAKKEKDAEEKPEKSPEKPSEKSPEKTEGSSEKPSEKPTESSSDKSPEKPKDAKDDSAGAGEAASTDSGKEAAGAEVPAEGGEEKEAIIFKFEPIVLNVVEKNALHYLKLQMAMECTTATVVEEIKSKTPELRDVLLFLINDMTLREILSSGGKALLKDDIKISFNKLLKKGEIKKIYFTDFTVQ